MTIQTTHEHLHAAIANVALDALREIAAQFDAMSVRPAGAFEYSFNSAMATAVQIRDCAGRPFHSYGSTPAFVAFAQDGGIIEVDADGRVTAACGTTHDQRRALTRTYNVLDVDRVTREIHNRPEPTSEAIMSAFLAAALAIGRAQQRVTR
jgi:hypothetical protein